MSTLHRFLLRVLLWLPICFGIWYFLSILFTAPLAAIVDATMTWLFPAVIERIAQHGSDLSVVTRVLVSAGAGAGDAVGDIVFEVNPLKYGYCVPLYTALVLASPGDVWALTGRWLAGLLLLLIVQVFGVSMEILKMLVLDLGTHTAGDLPFSAWGREGLALAYQFGFLILPPVAPIAIWFGQFQRNLPELIGAANASDRASTD